MLGAGSFFVSASVCLGLVGCLGRSGPLWRDRLEPGPPVSRLA